MKKSKKHNFFYRFCVTLVRLFFKIFYSVKIYGLENLEPGAGIIAANHSSYLDPPVIGIISPEPVHFLAKASLFKRSILGWIIRKLNTHPLKGSVKDVATFKIIQEILAQGEKVVLFPEGTRGFSEEISPMKRGVVLMVEKAKCTIFPLYLHGTYEAWNRTSKWPKLGKKIVCVFGKPIYYEEFLHLEPKEAQEQIMLCIQTSLNRLKKWCEEEK